MSDTNVGVGQTDITKIFAALNPNAHTVAVQFGKAHFDLRQKEMTFEPTTRRRYVYATKYALQEGDLVVVDTPSNGLVIVQVVRVDDFLDVSTFQEFTTLKWVIDRVNNEDYAKLQYKLQEFDNLMRKATAAETQAQMRSVLDDFESEEARGLVQKIKQLFHVSERS